MWFLEHATAADDGVSVDGTWQRNGFSSTLGVVAAISTDNGKVLDVVIFSKSCKVCTSVKKLPLLIPLDMRHRSHLVLVILIIKVLLLELKQKGATKFFSSSNEKHGLYYNFFMEMVATRYILLSNIYIYIYIYIYIHMYGPSKPIKKFECVGQYQKCHGSRLHDLKKNKKYKRTGRKLRTH